MSMANGRGWWASRRPQPRGPDPPFFDILFFFLSPCVGESNQIFIAVAQGTMAEWVEFCIADWDIAHKETEGIISKA